jgi:hypothetical protein
MTSTSIDPETNSAWRRLRLTWARVRDWPANGDSPYSPLFSVALLLGVALIIRMGV